MVYPYIKYNGGEVVVYEENFRIPDCGELYTDLCIILVWEAVYFLKAR